MAVLPNQILVIKFKYADKVFGSATCVSAVQKSFIFQYWLYCFIIKTF